MLSVSSGTANFQLKEDACAGQVAGDLGYPRPLKTSLRWSMRRCPEQGVLTSNSSRNSPAGEVFERFIRWLRKTHLQACRLPLGSLCIHGGCSLTSV